jgi:hypothetical protein
MITSLFGSLRSNAIALLALFIALGGTSFAAVEAALPKDSVGTAQVKDGSLLKRDFRAGQLPAGQQGAAGAPGQAGPAGAAGAAGPPGPAGAAGATNVSIRTNQTTGAGSLAVNVDCNAGEKVVGGGAAILAGNVGDYINQSYPTATGWGALAYHASSKTLKVYVICAAP